MGKIEVKWVEVQGISPHVIMVKLHIELPQGEKWIKYELADKIRDKLNEVLNK